ncbi:MAG: TIM barrel protein [Candidatus Poribacteria bacterium]|nr:TIM barrel protein [Candidatus Poribacteria bacterium]
MKLSLSTRIAESFSDKEKAAVPFEAFSQLAKDNGYHAICMRASVAGIQSPKERVVEIHHIINRLNLAVSMVTGDFAIPQNSERGPDALRNITPYLDLAESFPCVLMRICMKKEEDISWVERACDEAAERGIRLAHQCHAASLFETIEGSMEVLRRVDRPNFGIIYEPANLRMCGQTYGLEALRAFEPYLFNVYLQNYLPNPEGGANVETWVRGTVYFDHIPLHDPRGVNWHEVFDALEAVGYDGYVTVHQALAEIMSPAEAAQVSADYLRSLQKFEDYPDPLAGTMGRRIQF